MLKWVLGLLLAFVLAFAVRLISHLGIFRPVEIETGVRPAMGLLYKDHIGPYHKINSAISAVETWAKENKIDCSLTFGEYFDDPGAIEEVRLRSRGGCVLSAKPIQFPSDFKYEDSPESRAVVAKFSGAPSIGPYRVYNNVTEYMTDARMTGNGPSREVYQILSDNQINTTYYFPIH